MINSCSYRSYLPYRASTFYKPFSSPMYVMMSQSSSSFFLLFPNSIFNSIGHLSTRKDYHMILLWRTITYTIQMLKKHIQTIGLQNIHICGTQYNMFFLLKNKNAHFPPYYHVQRIQYMHYTNFQYMQKIHIYEARTRPTLSTFQNFTLIPPDLYNLIQNQPFTLMNLTFSKLVHHCFHEHQ